MKYALAIVALVSIAITAGCYQADIAGAGGGAVVQMHTLPDGTQCAVLVGHSKGAIDCNWRANQ